MKAQRPGRSVVVVPAYCCPSVPDAVKALGLELRAAPVSADLNLDLDRVAPLIKEDVLAVVGVHMYGLPLDMARLKLLAQTARVFVVDDAAHVVERTDGRAPLGLAGDVGLLSFNQSKTLTGGSPDGGGALLVTNSDLQAGISKRVEALGEGKSRARAYLWFALRFGIEITPRALTEYTGNFDERAARAMGIKTERSERMSAAAALAVRAQINRLDEIKTGRTALVGRYLNVLRNHRELEFVQATSPRYLSRMLVRWQRGPHASEVRETLARQGFATRNPYPLWTASDDATADAVRTIAATHLELPGAPQITDAEIEELVTALALCLKSNRVEAVGRAK
jgi:dTDP-4-amino-4,6-dideoxygalactose transaminase